MIINKIVDKILDKLARDFHLNIYRFGTFKVKKAKKGKIKTKYGEVQSKYKYRVVFKTSVPFKEALNRKIDEIHGKN